VNRYIGYVDSEFNDIQLLYTKNNSERKQVRQPKLLNIFYDIKDIKVIYFTIRHKYLIQ